MAILAALNIESILGTTLNILYVAFGLGMVIFFHELGHFAVAKWCNVLVERFSIGFGPILWRVKWGETEYALSAIPIGGYVKMLGQDDIDPSQMSAEEIAQDPRSYSAQSVGARMAIISAGVIMNVATALLFFAGGFGMGVEKPPPILGSVEIGLPAWKAGLHSGDEITRINDRNVEVFSDIMYGVALSVEKKLTVEGKHPDGTRFKVKIQPDEKSTRRRIGAVPTVGLKLIKPQDEKGFVTVPGTSASAANPPFEPGDVISRIDETDVATFSDLQQLLARKRSREVSFYVNRKRRNQPIEIVTKPRRFRRLGLQMDMGPVSAIVEKSPAAEAGLKVGDKITTVDDMVVGQQIDPLRLPDYFADHHGQEVKIDLMRPAISGEDEELTIRLRPLDKPGWTEKPDAPGLPISSPAVGIAYHLNSTVRNVGQGSPAFGKIEQGERIQQMELFLSKDAPRDGFKEEPIVIKFDQKQNDERIQNWAYAFWLMQSFPGRDVKLLVRNAGKVRTVDLKPRPIEGENWYLPTRGIRLGLLMKTQKAASTGKAIQMGLTHTKNALTDIYLTLRNLFGGRLSVRELHGPIGIATVAYQVASNGIPDLLLFLGFLSVNLAVLNFLPIPVLDGGHMVFLIWEAVTRKKPSEKVLVAATYVGMAFVLGLMLLVFYLDIFVHGIAAR